MNADRAISEPKLRIPESLLEAGSGPLSRNQLIQTVLQGLRRKPKSLPPKLLYDQRGSELFDRICDLEEYYPTRTEQAILDTHGAEMAELIGSDALLMELGSGASRKTRTLLDRLKRPAAYLPIDISSEFLEQTARTLRATYPRLPVFPICADFTQELNIPEPLVRPVRNRVMFFPGSTIGNFDPPEARALLERIARFLVERPSPGGAGRLLVGVDLIKSEEVLRAAYNDSRGITAEFNLNLLKRLNREAGTDFDIDRFTHEAHFNSKLKRVEMHLVSAVEQDVRLGEETFSFFPGETIQTESSYKYDPGHFSRLANQASLRTVKSWTDEKDYFSVFLLEPR